MSSNAPHPLNRVLVVGALDEEVRALRHHLTGLRREGPWLRVGNLGAWEVGFVSVGVGREKAAARTREALSRWDAGWVLSVGTCGALADDIGIGRVVTARAVLGQPTSRVRVVPVLRPVNLVTVDAVVYDPEARTAHAEKGAQICDMEATGVMEAAADRDFSAVKVVSDQAGAGRDLPLKGPLRPIGVASFKVRARLLGRLRLAPEIVKMLRETPIPA